MSEWDTTALLSDIKERGSLPDNDLRFTDVLLLAAATKEMREAVAPMLAAGRAEHLVYPYSQAVVSGTASYRMPPRAIGGSLRDVAFITAASQPIRLRQLSADEVEEVGRLDNTGTPYAYWLQSYRVVLVGTPNVAGTLSMPYYARPNALATVGASTAGTIINIGGDEATIQYTVEFSSSGNADDFVDAVIEGTSLVDVVRATPGFETLAVDVDPSGGGLDEPTTVQVDVAAADLDSGDMPTLGDYLCVAGSAPVPQLPVELHGLLAARTARRALKAVGDDRWQALNDDVAELEDRAKAWIATRVSGDTQQAGGQVGDGLVGGMGWAFGWY
jgi:hypothetical protein